MKYGFPGAHRWPSLLYYLRYKKHRVVCYDNKYFIANSIAIIISVQISEIEVFPSRRHRGNLRLY